MIKDIEYIEINSNGELWSFLNIENVGCVATTKEDLEDGVDTLFYVHLREVKEKLEWKESVLLYDKVRERFFK